jgi:hypothetical protein
MYFKIISFVGVSCFLACGSEPEGTSVSTNIHTEIIQDSVVTSDTTLLIKSPSDCQQIECKVWARVNISEQLMYLYADGRLVHTFQVTTGNTRHKTPIMNRKPTGPMYVKYSSRKFPGGNYMGLGNMPYAVFIRGGYAIHGTTKGNIKLLGKKVSHGCIRLHPNNAQIFYDMIKEVGLENVWVTTET